MNEIIICLGIANLIGVLVCLVTLRESLIFLKRIADYLEQIAKNSLWK